MSNLLANLTINNDPDPNNQLPVTDSGTILTASLVDTARVGNAQSTVTAVTITNNTTSINYYAFLSSRGGEIC